MEEVKIKISPEFPMTYYLKDKDNNVIMQGTVYSGILSADLEDCKMECD